MPYSDILKQADYSFAEQGMLKINNSKVIVRYVTIFAAGWAIVAYLLNANQLLIAALIAFFGFFAGIVLHIVEMHLLARVFWLLAANIAIFIASLVTPQEGNMNFIFLASAIIPLVVFRPSSHRIWIMSLVCLSLGLWISSQMPGFRSFFEVDLDQETAKTILSPAASFTTFGVVLFVAGYFTQKSETQLSALRKGHDKMVASDTLKKRLLVNLSHELRTPLHAVHGYAGLLQDDFAKLPPEILSQARSYPHQILKSCQSLRCILDNMFQFVTWDDAPFIAENTQISLRDEVSSILDEYAGEISAKQLDIDLSEIGLLCIQSDKRMVNITLKQVIENSIKFTPEKGSVAISSTVLPDESIELHVKDTGPGFPGGASGKAFTPFERLKFATSSTPGVGIGLPLARAAAERIGGQIKVVHNARGGEYCKHYFESAQVYRRLIASLHATISITSRCEQKFCSASAGGMFPMGQACVCC